MKKILFILPNLSSGGAERVVSLLSNKMHELGINVEIILINDHDRAYKIDNEIKIHVVETKKNEKRSFLSKARLLIYFHNLFKKNKNAIVIPFQSMCLKYAMTAKIGTKVRVIACERNDPYNLYTNDNIKNNAFRLFSKADYCVFQTESARSFYSCVKDNKCKIIVNPVTIPKQYWKGNLDEHNLITISRLSPQKNLKMGIDAVDILYHKYGVNVNYKIFGKGELYNELNNYISALGLEDIISLCGTTNQVEEELCEASVFILPSNYEGISNSMLEALAVGIPAICTDCPAGGARQMINNNNGILIPVGDTDALVNKILYLFNNKSDANNLSLNEIRSMEPLSVDNIIKLWIEIFNLMEG